MTPTQADSPQSRTLSRAGQGPGHQRRHCGEVVTAHRCGRPLQSSQAPDQGLAARCGTSVELVAEGLVAGSGHGLGGLAADRLSTSQSFGSLSGTGPIATASASQPATLSMPPTGRFRACPPGFCTSIPSRCRAWVGHGGICLWRSIGPLA